MKQLNLVSYLETFSLLEQAKLSKDSKEKDAFFQMAITRIEESVRSTPGNELTEEFVIDRRFFCSYSIWKHSR